MAAAGQDNGSTAADENIVPQWKRELISRRRAIARNLPAGSSSVQFTCPPVIVAVRQPEPHVAHRSPCQSSASAVGENVVSQCIDKPASTPSSMVVDGNMRLVEHEAHRRSGATMINGGLDGHNNAVDPVKYRAIMGEEKSGKKSPSCATNNRKMDNSAGVKFVLGDHNSKAVRQPAVDETPLSDSSEELQYGPGIVKKLKSKYMSMTLRDNKNKGARPALPQMRRATSLENLIDNDRQEAGKPPLIRPAKFAKRPEAPPSNKSHQQRYRGASRGNESIKRARSVEALLRYEVVVAKETKDEIVIVEKAVEEKPPVAAAARKKRPAMNGLPPADVVKTTRSLFEHGVACGNLAKLNVNKAASGKPMLSPKPSPEKIRRAKPVAMDAERKARLLSPVTVEVHELAGRDVEPAATPPSPWFPSATGPVAEATPSPGSPRQPPPVSPSQRTLSPVAMQPSPVVKPSSPVAKQPSPVAKLPSPAARQPSSPVAKLPSPVARQPSSPVAKLPSPVAKQPSSPVAKLPSPIAKQPAPVAKLPSPVARQPSPVFEAPSPASVVTNGNGPATEDWGEQDGTDGCVRKAVTAKSLENIRQGGSTVEFCFNKAVETAKPSYLPGGDKTPVSSAPKSAVAANPAKSPAPSAPSIPASQSGPSLLKASQSNASVPKSSQSGGSVLKSSQPGASLPKSSQSGPSVLKSSQSGSGKAFPEKRSPMSPLPDVKSPDFSKQVCVIRPIVQPVEPVARLTDRELKKNLINKCEQPTKVVASLKASEIVSGNVSDSLKEVKSLRDSVNSNGTGLWETGKKPWNQQQNTMVFNFKDRKEVPDYIENDGIVMRVKREKIRPGDSGFILLDPSLEESSTDCELDEPLAGPPSPCNVQFEGDNVLINGKSSLRKHPRRAKLRITFNDDAMQLFEYPSESSLLGDAATATCSGLPPAPSCPTPALPSGVGGNLSSYTSKVSMTTEDFQLGVSRTMPQPRPRDPAVAAETVDTAVAEDNVAWSQGANDHLMF